MSLLPFRRFSPVRSFCLPGLPSPSAAGRFAFLIALLGLVGCETNKPSSADAAPAAPKKEESSDANKAPSAKDMAQKNSDLPPEAEVQSVVNSRRRSPYSGKTGTVRGIVHVKGDAAPELPKVLSKIESNCTRAAEMFGKVFREGESRTLADVLVAVTEYDGYVPAQTVDVPVKAEGCAWESRTIAVTFGQRLVIDGVDNRPYVPEILGQAMPAQLFVLPTAPDVEIPPKRPGRHKLVDSMRLYNVAELFVLPYATVDVTGIDGKFEISGIPVGKVKINALLPQTGAVDGKEITISSGEVTEVKFELTFDAEAYEKLEKPVPLDEIPGPKDPPLTKDVAQP